MQARGNHKWHISLSLSFKRRSAERPSPRSLIGYSSQNPGLRNASKQRDSVLCYQPTSQHCDWRKKPVMPVVKYVHVVYDSNANSYRRIRDAVRGLSDRGWKCQTVVPNAGRSIRLETKVFSAAASRPETSGRFEEPGVQERLFLRHYVVKNLIVDIA